MKYDVVALGELLDGVVPEHALVLGTGGASQAVQYALTELGIPFDLIAYRRNERLVSVRQGLRQAFARSHHIPDHSQGASFIIGIGIQRSGSCCAAGIFVLVVDPHTQAKLLTDLSLFLHEAELLLIG